MAKLKTINALISILCSVVKYCREQSGQGLHAFIYLFIFATVNVTVDKMAYLQDENMSHM